MVSKGIPGGVMRGTTTASLIGAQKRLPSALKLPLGRDRVPEMIRLVLTEGAYDAIASNATEGLGSVAYAA